MSSLVSDLFINPIRRQVRRFSRPSINSDHIDSLTNQHVIHDHFPESPHNIDEDVGDTAGTGQDGRYNAVFDAENALPGAPMVSSPIDEHGGLEQESAAVHPNHSASTSGTVERTHSVPLRLSSLRSDARHVDDDVSDNPEFGILDQFHTESPRHMSTSSHTHNPGLQTQTRTDGPSRRSTQDRSRSTSLNPDQRQRNKSLPEDDGMGVLRRRILLIQESDLHAEEKARLMQKLLTEGHRVSSQSHQYEKTIPIPQSLSKTISQDMPPSPGSLSSLKFWPVSGTPNSSHSGGGVDRFHLSPDDLRATYAPIVPREPSVDDNDEAEETVEQVPALGCRHYRRNVKLQCSQCQKWYTCRFCHDEVEDHVLIRKETKNMLCMLCGCAQRATEVCIDCNVRSAWYYCSVCKLWDDDTNKNIYHCHDCGICRIGRGLGKDFYHCKTCGVCMSIAIEHSHKCIERSTDCDCPICGEYMFTSPQTVVFMNCGHSIHHKCYYDHMKSSYKCPICSKSIVNMETQFRNLDRAIDSQPMPPQFRDTKAMVSCNDCQAKSAVKYHWLGLKCAVCDSYNTAQLSILSDPEPGETATADPIVEGVDVQALENTLSVNRSRSNIIPNRHRRASSQQGNRPISSASHAAPSRFSPYPLPQRLGRSVSPLRNYNTEELLVAIEPTRDDSDDEEDDMDFWGRDGSTVSADLDAEQGNGAEDEDEDEDEDEEEEEEEEEEEDDYDDDSGSAMEEDDEEGDEDGDDQMELFGHR